LATPGTMIVLTEIESNSTVSAERTHRDIIIKFAATNLLKSKFAKNQQ
jgi:hypothetical protein